MAKKPKYDVDDRGNVVDFYDASDDIVATLDREACVNGVQDVTTWNGDSDVTKWAKANGYAVEIKSAVVV